MTQREDFNKLDELKRETIRKGGEKIWLKKALLSLHEGLQDLYEKSELLQR
jgi:hypothetical protein